MNRWLIIVANLTINTNSPQELGHPRPGERQFRRAFDERSGYDRPHILQALDEPVRYDPLDALPDILDRVQVGRVRRKEHEIDVQALRLDHRRPGPVRAEVVQYQHDPADRIGVPDGTQEAAHVLLLRTRHEIYDRDAVQSIEAEGVGLELRRVLPDLRTAERPTLDCVRVGLRRGFIQEADHAPIFQSREFFLAVPRRPLDADGHVGKV
jgi:hypothetical protein